MTTLRKLIAEAGGISLSLDFLRFSSFAKDTDTETDFRYGHDFDDVREKDGVRALAEANVVGHRYLEGSDYSGGSLIRGNIKAVKDEIPEEFRVSAHGGYNTEAVYFRLDVESEDGWNEKALEILQGLENYPAVDDEAVSEVEAEAESEDWASYGRTDFLRSLETTHGLERDSLEISPEALDSLFWQANSGDGALVVHEESPGVYFDTDKAAERTSAALLFLHGKLALDFEDTLAIVRGDDPGEAFRLLRLVRIGKALQALRDRIAREIAPTVDPENGPRTEQGMQTATEWISGASIDAGDTSASLDEAALANVPCRSFVITFRRHVWEKGMSYRLETFPLTIDPFGPVSSDVYVWAPAVRDFMVPKRDGN